MTNILRLSLLLVSIVPQLLIAQSFEGKEQLASFSVYFASGKSFLDAQSKAQLDAAASQFDARDTSLRITVAAYTDEKGDSTRNQALSQRRAEAVTNYLIGKGVPKLRFSATFFGESKPLNSNSSEEERRLNRRADVQIWRAKPLPKPSPFKNGINLTGELKDNDTGKPLQGQVMLEIGTYRDSTKTDSLGKWSILAPRNASVILSYDVPGYFLKSDALVVKPELKPFQTQLPKPAPGKSIDLDNILFIGDAAIPLPSSMPQLIRLVEVMRANGSFCIEIQGHVNQPNTPVLPETDPYFQLSVERAKTVYTYLTTHGVSRERLTYKGFGNSRMRFPNATEERQMVKNRRVEVLIRECE